MNILFIPHVPNLNVINRVYEFSKISNSHFLYWHIDNSNLVNKIKSQIFSLKFSQKDKMVQIPLLFKPESIAVVFNTFMINRLIDKLQIDVVVNANALLFDIKSIKVPVVYDLVDDHLTVNSDIGLNEKRVKKIERDLTFSQGVVCVTDILKTKAKKFNSNIITVENGLYLERFKNAKSLKKDLEIENKKVFGFIGGIDEWTGIEKAIQQYLKIKDDTTAFLIVGGNNSTFYKYLVEKYGKDILFVGQITPEKVGDYFKTIDVGLIPFELNDFTHNALPIKALEYALAGGFVISTPLKGLMQKDFPFIKFCDIEDFHNNMQVEFKEVRFDFESYSWENQTNKLINFIKGCL